ncbi:checkpoint protein Hus1/Mec3 [Halteromyces radiatus]|uniref:checkpoint protein Hus1/Mec3 n=1 Tax=Halteromyces radiatus TaxID=101107 RepID=UPI0022205DF2|nr:checkpoint protein Hus1/Mec3 [Halteromyces radiatus]KAI8098912.1 checkpoint protein Hus1/Mec3 [Halteromyces radiatus]
MKIIKMESGTDSAIFFFCSFFLHVLYIIMKLAATLINPIGLHKIALTLERLGSSCIICFTPDSIRFIWYQQYKPGIRSWINVDPHTLFSQYRVKSQDNDEVNLSVDLDNFVHATKAAQQADETKIDLAQRIQNGQREVLLIWRMQLESRAGNMTDARFDLHVNRLPGDRIRLVWDPPVLADPETYIIFPNLLAMKPIVDRMKSLSKYMTIAANMNGQLKLSVNTDMAQVDSVFSHLGNPRLEGHETNQHKDQFASVEVLTEDLANFLNCHNLEPRTIICVITEQSCLAFYVYVNLDVYSMPNEHHSLLMQRPETILTCHIPVYIP